MERSERGTVGLEAAPMLYAERFLEIGRSRVEMMWTARARGAGGGAA